VSLTVILTVVLAEALGVLSRGSDRRFFQPPPRRNVHSKLGWRSHDKLARSRFLACIGRYCMRIYFLHSLFSLVAMWLVSIRPSLAQLVLPGCIRTEGSSASSLFRLLACIRRYCSHSIVSALAVFACDHEAGIIPSANHSRSLCLQSDPGCIRADTAAVRKTLDHLQDVSIFTLENAFRLSLKTTTAGGC